MSCSAGEGLTFAIEPCLRSEVCLWTSRPQEAVQEGELETSETVQIGDRTRRQGTDRLSANGHRMIRSGHVRLDLAKKTNPIFR